MSMHLPERRRDARLDLHRPVKLQCNLTGRFIPARTRNLSVGGALIELRTRTPLLSGQTIRVGIADHDRQAILAHASMTPARVVRSLAHDGLQQVAIEFAMPNSMVAA